MDKRQSANRTADLAFHTRKDGTLAERMRINSSGNVGIGTSSPITGIDLRGTGASAGNTIQIVGNSQSTLLLGQDADGGVIRGQGGNNALKFYTGGTSDSAANASGTERMRIDSSGGIRASSGSRVLASSTGVSTPDYSFASDGSMGMYRVPGSLAFATGSTERMRIDSSGRVGIAQDTPADFNAAADDLVIGNSGGDFGMTIRTGTASNG